MPPLRKKNKKTAKPKNKKTAKPKVKASKGNVPKEKESYVIDSSNSSDGLFYEVCACAGAGSIFHEHSYSKNYRELCDRYSKECNVNIVPSELIQVAVSLEEKEICESVLEKLLKSKEVSDKRKCPKCGNLTHPKYFAKLSPKELKICENLLAKLLKKKRTVELTESCRIISFIPTSKTAGSYVAKEFPDPYSPVVRISHQEQQLCQSVMEKLSQSKNLTEPDCKAVKQKYPEMSSPDRKICQLMYTKLLETTNISDDSQVKFLLHVVISEEEKALCESMVENLSQSEEVTEAGDVSNSEPKFLLNIEMSPKNRKICSSMYKKVLQSTAEDTCVKCSSPERRKLFIEEITPKEKETCKESSELPREAGKSSSIEDFLPKVDVTPEKQNLHQPEEIMELEELCEAKKMSEELCGTKKICELENSNEIISLPESCETGNLLESGKLYKVSENIESCTNQMPVRRSLRQMNKIEKDVSPTSGISNSVHSQISSNETIETRKERYSVSLNSTIISKNEIKNVNGENNVEVLLKNGSNLQSPTRENTKQPKLPNPEAAPDDCNIDSMKTPMEDFITPANTDCKKKSDFTVTKSKRKRTLSEPSKCTLSSPDLESIEKDKLKAKKLKSLDKLKDSDKIKPSEKVKKRKRNLSAPVDKTLKEDFSKNSVKSSEISNKKIKKCLSLSEESSTNILAKVDVQKKSLPESKHEVIDLATSSSVVKQKTKKRRKDNLRYIMNDNEPALFSQPHVLMKVKSSDSSRKEIKTAAEDKKTQSQVKNCDKIFQMTGSVSNQKSHTNQDQEHEKCFSDIKNQEIISESTIVTSVAPLGDSPNETDKLESEALEFNSYDKIKEFDCDNSLHIDESNSKNFEKENKENSKNETNEMIPDISCRPEEVSTNKESNFDNHMKENLDSSEHKVTNSVIEELDSDKRIAERKPRRTIKKKKIYEDITSRNSSPAKKSPDKQKGVEKKTLKKKSKQGKRKTSYKSDMESEESEEDDPGKLWCICRRPHNERFMIMCDHCAEWFHGKCVGITKKEGRKLEKLGKEWICPKCLNKEAASTVEKEKEIEPEQKKVTDEKTVYESKEIQPSTKDEIIDRITKPELKSTEDKQIPSLTNTSIPTMSTPKNKKIVNLSPGNKKNLNRNVPSTSKGFPSFTIKRKGLKEPVLKKYCVSCQAILKSVLSCYCSDKCIEKHANDCLKVLREVKDSLKGPEFDSQRITVIERYKGNMIRGDTAPAAFNIISWLKSNPSYMIALPSGASLSSKNSSPKNKVGSAASSRVGSELTDLDNEDTRLSIRRKFKECFMKKINEADDINVKDEDVRRIAVEIEKALYSAFKDCSRIYFKRYRSLYFKINDEGNEGFFRKILQGNIPPDKLVQMTPNKLASPEMCTWREKTNQHSLDMIKRFQLQQQS